MPTPADSDAPTVCPHCHEAVPEGARLCPHCGTSVPPLPHLGNAPTDTAAYLTKSHGGDIAVGVAGGFLVPPGLALLFLVTFGVLTSQINWNASGGAGSYTGLIITFWGTILLWFGVMFYLLRRMEKSRLLAITLMRRFFLGWLGVGAISFLGLLATCLINIRR